jgi:hypothetical protein
MAWSILALWLSRRASWSSLKLAKGFHHRPFQPQFVEAEIGEDLGLVAESSGVDERGMDIGVFGIEVAGSFRSARRRSACYLSQ